VLSWTPDPENLQVIVSSIFDEDRDVRIAAAECLRRHLEWLDARGGLDENVDDIIGLTTRVFDNSLELQPFYGRILKIAARYLGTTGKRRVIEALITIASKGLPSTRAAGLRALGKMKVRKARPLFTKGLKSGHSGIRFASIDGLGALGYADTVPELMKALEQTNDREEQHMIGLALAKTGSEEAETALLELLGNRKLSAKIIACNFLGETKSDRALVPLTTLFMKSKASIMSRFPKMHTAPKPKRNTWPGSLPCVIFRALQPGPLAQTLKKCA
jgi:HEAT repeat protein